jgi:uncharacterized protein
VSDPVHPDTGGRGDTMLSRIRSELHAALDLTRQAFLSPGAAPVVLASALLLIWQYYGYPSTYRYTLSNYFDTGSWEPIADSLYWTASNVVMLLAIPLVAARLFWGKKPRQLGLGLGNWRLGLSATAIFYVIMIPFVLFASTQAEFIGTYPLDTDLRLAIMRGDPDVSRLFWVYEVGYAFFFVGWEFFFRGFLLFLLEPILGPVAIAVQMMPFALLHLGKPIAESVGSILAGGLLGVLAWRTRSIWYCAAIHACVAITMDMIVYFRAF